MTTEFELKFQVPAAQAAAVEADVARGRSSRVRLQAHYFDTADGALARERIVLRVRREGPLWVQTAKAPGATLLERLEHEVPLDAAGDEAPPPDIARHRGTAVGRALAKALRQAGHGADGASLQPTYRMDVMRHARRMRSGDAMLELAFDQGTLVAGARERRICELEIELKEGDARSLLELARRWRKRHGLWLDTVPKSARGEQLAAGLAHGTPTRARAPGWPRPVDGAGLFRAALAACSAQVFGNASEVAAGDDAGEAVHQLRVGIRRLRTLLRELDALNERVPEQAWDDALATAFRALGAQRDRELLRTDWQPRIEAAGGPPLHWPADPAQPGPTELVRSAAFQGLLLDLVEASLAPPADATDAAATSDDDGDEQHDDRPAAARGKALRRLVGARLERLHRQLLRAGQRFDRLDAAGRHRARKRLKRLRYLAELTAGLFGEKAVARYLQRLTPAQEALGHEHDAGVAAQAYRSAQPPDAGGFALGWLAAQAPEQIAACRKALRKIDGAARYWRGH